MTDVDAEILLAVDGGGTQSRFALVAGGRRMEITRGPANVSTDFDGAIATLTEGIEALADSAGVSVNSAPAHLALAGVVGDEIAARVKAALPLKNANVSDDRIAAVTGALGDGNGCVIGIGTGSFLGRKTGRNISLIGGWGLTLGDEASGAFIGRELLRHALRAEDGLAERSELTDRIVRNLGGATAVVEFASGAGPEDFAGFAPMITAAAFQGDPVARRIVNDGVGYIRDGLLRLGWRSGERICPVGGLAGAYGPFLPDDMAADLAEPEGTALDGALALAARLSTTGPG